VYEGNFAWLYGNDIASFATRLVVIEKEEYERAYQMGSYEKRILSTKSQRRLTGGRVNT